MAASTLLLLAVTVLVPCVRPQSLGLSAQIQAQKVAKAIELNDKAQLEATEVINNEVSIASALNSAVTEVGIYVGTQMVQDLFNEGVLRVRLSNDELKKTDLPSAVNIDITIGSYSLVAVNAFKECVAASSILSKLTSFFVNQGSRLVKVNTDAINFRVNVQRCSTRAVDLANQTDECIATTKTQYPYPVVPQYQINTLDGINAMYNCINAAAVKLNATGGVTIDQLKKYLPYSLQSSVPKKFDLRPQIAGIEAGITSYIPQAKVQEVFKSLNRTKNIIKLAARDKLMTFLQAKAFLKDLTSPYNAVLSKLSVPTSALYCKTNAEVAGVRDLNLKSSALLTCIALTELPPNIVTHNILEDGFKDRELKERLFNPSLECAKDLHTSFNKSRLQTCVKLAEKSYWAVLNQTQLTSDSYFTSAYAVRELVRKCMCKAEIDLQRQLREDLWDLETCLMKATKKRPNIVPRTGFCPTANSCRFANISIEDDEGEIVVPDENATTTKPSTVDDRNDFSTDPTDKTDPITPTTPTTPITTKPTVKVTPKPDPNSCTVFNSTFGADGCGVSVVYPTLVITPAKVWDVDIKFD